MNDSHDGAPVEDADRPTGRRALIAGAAAGAAGLVVGQATAASAANGSAVILGTVNSASATTTVNVASSGIGFQVKQTGAGAAMYFEAKSSNGVAGRTSGANAYGFSAANVGGAGSGAALAASGINNTGVLANTANADKDAVVAVHQGDEGIGAAMYAAGGLNLGIYAQTDAPDTTFALYADGGFYADSFNGVEGTLAVLGEFIAEGTAEVVGDLDVTGTLTKAAGTFKIDHPLDPQNRWLYHSFVESPEMLNVYAGTAVLDADGSADVELPSYFDALNSDHRYQLTPVCAAMPQLHVSAEVSGNSFSIAGGVGGAKVSWQVSGVRQDAYALANPVVPEVDKTAAERTSAKTSAGPVSGAGAEIAAKRPTSRPKG